MLFGLDLLRHPDPHSPASPFQTLRSSAAEQTPTLRSMQPSSRIGNVARLVIGQFIACPAAALARPI
jgi:hypothetical protein